MSRRRQLLLLQCFSIHWLFCQADGFPLMPNPTMMRHPFEPSKRRAWTTNSQPRHRSKPIDALSWRGGAVIASTASWTQQIVSSSTACWVVLILTVICESLATSISKQSRDLKSKRLFGLACALYLLSMWGFNLSLAQVPVGIAYAVWSALGTTLVTTMGILHFDESMNWKKAICLLLIVAGVVGLNIG